MDELTLAASLKAVRHFNLTGMKKIFTLLFSFTGFIGQGQNLVPNPSFEEYSACPNNGGQLSRAIGWINPTATSPDYFNGCAPAVGLSVPQSGHGYEPAVTGVAYIALITAVYNPFGPQGNYREYAEVQLTDSLIAGVEYCVKFYVSPADSSSKLVSNNIGAYFSDTLIDSICFSFPASQNCFLPLIPQVENPSSNSLYSRDGWTEVSGSFIATGGEKYLIIGNFRDSTNTTTVYTGWGHQSTDWAFYFVDDVSVMRCDSVTSVNESHFNDEFSLYPNPFSNQLTFGLSNNEQTVITLYDFLSQQILQRTFINVTTLNTEQLADGIYFYKLRNDKGVVKNGKVIKQ